MFLRFTPVLHSAAAQRGGHLLAGTSPRADAEGASLPRSPWTKPLSSHPSDLAWGEDGHPRTPSHVCLSVVNRLPRFNPQSQTQSLHPSIPLAPAAAQAGLVSG